MLICQFLSVKLRIGGANIEINDATAAVEEYDLSTDTWIQRSDTPVERQQHSSITVGGKIYIIGGASGGIFQSLVEEYIPGSVNVEARGKLPTKWGEVKSD